MGKSNRNPPLPEALAWHRAAILTFALGCAGLLTGCGAGASKASPRADTPAVGFPDPYVKGPVNQGIYVIEDAHDSEVKLVLSPARGFILRLSKGGCVLQEHRGSWQAGMDSLRLNIYGIRFRNSCSSPWQLRKSDSAITVPVRFAAGLPVPSLPGSLAGKGDTRWLDMVRLAPPRNGREAYASKGQGKRNLRDLANARRAPQAKPEKVPES